jgi:hypothetical protein
MPTVARWLEDGFNLTYLAVIWTLVAGMLRRQGAAPPAVRPLALRFAVAFFLLALGDTFHVGLRVVASFGPGELVLGGEPMTLLGLGMMVTAYTVTGFYLLLVDARRARRGRRDGWFWLLESLLALRLVVMALPGNEWAAAVPPWGMGLVRNLPLAVAGTALAVLMVREAGADRAWRGVGWAMVASYACYLPVILFAAAVPALGLLMLPKTVAYVAMAGLAWRGYFAPPAAAPGAALPASRA